MEHADVLTAQLDYHSSGDALAKGIETTKARDHDVMQTALTQTAKTLLKAQIVTEEQKKAVMHFLEQDKEDKDADQLLSVGTNTMLLQDAQQGPSAHASDSHMGPTLQMFEDTKEKFEGKVTDTEKHETDDLHEHIMLRQDLMHKEATAQSARGTQAKRKAKTLQDAADSEGQLVDTRNSKDADTKFIADTDATCKLKADAFEQRQELRKEEIEALNKAIEILGGTPKSFAEKHLPQWL